MTQAGSGSSARRGRGLWVRTLLALLLYLAVLALLYAPSPILYDADSYYHLAVAREYASSGHESGLESIREGLLASSFGDKEFLFHVLLEPFVTLFDPATGGRLALTLLGALLLTLIAHLSLRAVGGWGLLIPLWLLIGSSEFTWRLVRLRPELLALGLIIAGLWIAGVGRYRWLSLVAALFALSYTAIHAFVGLFIVLSIVDGWMHRRWEWRLVVYPLVGALVGLVVHPQFPDNLAVWWFQSIEYFRFKGVLDVGTEIRPNFTDVVLMVNLGWWLGLVILWRSTETVGRPSESTRLGLAFGVGAAVFGALYLLMSRFSFYFIPLATLWLLFFLRGSGRRWSRRVRLPWHGHLPTALAWALCILISLPVASAELRRYRERTAIGPDAARIADREAFGAAVPAGAHVLAPWRTTPIYMFYAPQGRYLNVLDPVFLAASQPDLDRLQQRIFSGAEPDVPLVAATDLDSELIALPAAAGDPVLLQRLLADPRVELAHRGSHWLFRLSRDGGQRFVRDWRVVPPGSQLPPAVESESSEWEVYPRSSDPAGLTFEGYVDALRVSDQAECVAFARHVEPPVPADGVRPLLELVGAGPVALWLDDALLVQIRRGSGAVLGRGVEIPLDLSGTDHRLTVLSCKDPESGDNGFYLVRREGSQS